MRYPFKKIGILGGGQLAKMFIQKAKKMGFYVCVLDEDPECPASTLADFHLTKSFKDYDAIKEFSKYCDILTYDIEHVNVLALKELFAEGKPIYPSPQILEIVQNKFLQKQKFAELGLPVPLFKEVKSKEDLCSFGFPVVQKTKKGGYDGRGVLVLKTKEDIENAFSGDTFIEEWIPIKKELAVMIARNTKGEIALHPIVEMKFDPTANICDMVIAPAEIEDKIKKEIREIAISLVEKLDLIGILGIEFFLSEDNKVFINEVAPRPHNSGHYSIEACVTCQFEQHLRAITGLPLGDTTLLSPAVMINLLGAPNVYGIPVVKGLEEVLKISGVSFHFYGKKRVKPYRKMGHITIIDKDISSAIKKAEQVKKIIRIEGIGDEE